MNTIDQKILDILKADARTNNSEIGQKVGISRVAVKNRIEKMENSGIIKGYAAIVDEKHKPDGVEFIMDITSVPEYTADVIKTISKDDIIRRIMLATGESRIIAFGYAPQYGELEKYVSALYYRMKGISRITFQVILSVVKDVDGGIEYASGDSKE